MTELLLQICGLAPSAAGPTGPGGPLDLVLVAAGVIIVLLVCVYTVKFLVKPRERDPNHIKRRVLRDDVEPGYRTRSARDDRIL